MIYNQETNENQIGWDGTYKGENQPNEVYIYYFESTVGLNKEPINRNGTINLIR